MDENNQLDFALIGAQKSATSWMYYCLSDHPQICVPKKKLEAGYIGGPMFFEKGDSWFFDRFHCTKGQVKGDVSVEYMFDRDSVDVLARYMTTNPKLVLSLRNPVDRLVSGYFWLVRRGVLPNRPIQEGLAPLLDQRPGFPETVSGPLEEVVRRSCYGPQISTFTEYFGREALFVVLYDEVERDSLNTIRRIYDFLGVDATFTPPSLQSAPKRNTYNKWMLSLENHFGNNKALAKLINYGNQALCAFQPSGRDEILPSEFRHKLETLFGPRVEETADVLATLNPGQRPDPDMVRRLWSGQ